MTEDQFEDWQAEIGAAEDANNATRLAAIQCHLLLRILRRLTMDAAPKGEAARAMAVATAKEQS